MADRLGSGRGKSGNADSDNMVPRINSGADISATEGGLLGVTSLKASPS